MTEIESVCIFGSIARGAVDALSDKDVLIVSNDSERIRCLCKDWEARGYSVSSYTPSRLFHLKKVGSLFLQHLKTEGLIIQDKENWLERFLYSCQAKNSYDHEISNAFEMFRPIERLGETESFKFFANDVSYVALRNIGVLSAANKGKLVFSTQDVSKFFQEEFSVSNDFSDFFSNLRSGKVKYRGRQHAQKSGVEDIEKIRSRIGLLFGGDFLKKVPRSNPIRAFPMPYHTLRELEGCLVSHYDLDFLDSAAQDESSLVGTWWKAVVSPSKYCWQVKNLTSEHLACVQAILNVSIPESEARLKSSGCKVNLWVQL